MKNKYKQEAGAMQPIFFKSKAETSGNDPIQIDEGYITIVDLIVCNSEGNPAFKFKWNANEGYIPALKDGFWIVKFGLGGSGYVGHWNTNKELMDNLDYIPDCLTLSLEDSIKYYSDLQLSRDLKKFGNKEAVLAELKEACNLAVLNNDLRKSKIPNIVNHLLKKKEYHRINWKDLGFKLSN